MNEEKAALPRAVAEGELFNGVDCYVLDDGRRVISQRGILRALRNAAKNDGAEYGSLGRFVGRLPSRFQHLAAEPNIVFNRAEGGTAIGREARFLGHLCRAYASAYCAGELRKSQEHLGCQAVEMLGALATTGIEALVDEATGYQRTRAERELAHRYAIALRHEATTWELTFPPSLVRALAPLYGIAYAVGPYPRELRCPFGMIYDLIFGRDVAEEMRRRNEAPARQRHHQWLQPDAYRMLANELGIVEMLAGQCGSKDEFWRRMRAHYRGEPLQLGLMGS